MNVLAHFALRRALQRAGLLPSARVVIVTGDIYVLQSACTPDYAGRARGAACAPMAAASSANLWIAAELQRRFPALTVVSTHPGVVATNLGGAGGGALARRVRSWR